VAIPLTLIGIAPGHLIFGAFFTATSMIGMIALAGIMVRNGILLIDYLEARLGAGIPVKQAIIEAGAVRTRPIALTAGTVVIGAVVILFDPIFQGLAVALIMGALASTVLTLIVVPGIYFLMRRDASEAVVPSPVPAMAGAGAGSVVERGLPAASAEGTPSPESKNGKSALFKLLEAIRLPRLGREKEAEPETPERADAFDPGDPGPGETEATEAGTQVDPSVEQAQGCEAEPGEESEPVTQDMPASRHS
jgi:hypothetical protein